MMVLLVLLRRRVVWMLVGLVMVLQTTMVVHIAFSPAAVYHTSKLHRHRGKTTSGSQQSVCVTGDERQTGGEG